MICLLGVWIFLRIHQHLLFHTVSLSMLTPYNFHVYNDLHTLYHIHHTHCLYFDQHALHKESCPTSGR